MLEAVISSSVLIIIIILIRRIFRGRIKNTLIYSLWLLAALRLLLPFGLAESRISVLNLFSDPAAKVPAILTDEDAAPNSLPSESHAAPAADSENTAVSETVPNTSSPLLLPNTNLNLSSPYSHKDGCLDIPNESRQHKAPISTAVSKITKTAFAIWLAVMVGMILWFVIANAAFYTQLRRKRKELPCNSPIKVYSVEGLRSPCLFGLIRPSVYVTEEAADSDSLDYIIAHELCHCRHMDILWAAIRCILLAVYWFDPLVWAAAIVSKQDCEYACDEAAIKRLGESRRFDYGKALLSMIPAAAPSLRAACIVSTNMSLGGRALKRRVEFIASRPKNGFAAVVMAVLIAVAAVGCTFTSPKAGETDSRTKDNSGSSADSSDHADHTDPAYIVSAETLPNGEVNADKPIDAGSDNYTKTVYRKSADTDEKLGYGFMPGVLEVLNDNAPNEKCYYAENGELIPVTFQAFELPKFTSVYGEETSVAYLSYTDGSGKIRAETIASSDYIEVCRYGSRIYFSDDIMLYCYDKSTGEITKPLPQSPFGFTFEDYLSAENPSDYNETVTWFSGIGQSGSKLYYKSDKSLDRDSLSPAYEWGLWSYESASGEERRILRFKDEARLFGGADIIDNNTLLTSEETAEGWLYCILDLTRIDDELIDLAAPAAVSELKARGVIKNTVLLPKRAWNVNSGEALKYLYYTDGADMTVIDIAALEEHVFTAKGELSPNFADGYGKRIAFQNTQGDKSLYILNLSYDTMTVIKNQPGERMFFEGWSEGEIRIGVYADSNNSGELVRYEGIRFADD